MKLLEKLNQTYYKCHKNYEDLFWIYYMGDHSVEKSMNDAEKAREAFRTDTRLYNDVVSALSDKKVSKKDKEKLSLWKTFFERYQVPESVKEVKNKIIDLESKLHKDRSTRKEGYIDPKTGSFVEASKHKMGAMVRTDDSEDLRKACFSALDESAVLDLDGYIELVQLRNQYAKALGYSDFYAYKAMVEEGMKKEEIFSIFDSIYEKTKYAFKDIRALEKTKPNLRKPWNFGYMMAGSFTKEEDPYFPFEESIIRWGTSFAALGFTFAGGELTLDLLDRKGKYNNGFCHWPKLVSYKNGKRVPGSSNFTCNVVYGQVGTGFEGMNTLFHEGGHAAHLLNSTQTEVCVNHEYPPMSTAWAETHSMFIDTILSSIEWRMRYAKSVDGKEYPFDLFERKVKQLEVLAPLDLMGIMSICELEKRIYEAKTLTKEFLIKTAKEVFLKYTDRSEASVRLLDVPHLYAWGSACSYHGYGLAEIALAQWRAYFYKKYGYIVDNPKIGKEIKDVWKLGASKAFAEMIKIATGKKLTSTAYIDSITMKADKKIKIAKERVKKVTSIKPYTKKIELDAKIKIMHGTELIADSKKGFEKMAEGFKKYLLKAKK